MFAHVHRKIEFPGMPGTMRAARLQGPEKMVVESCSIPRFENDEALVRIASCGVCASNVPPWEGRPWFSYPFEPGSLGHEATGTIVERGADFSAHAIGERVALLSQKAYAEYDVANADTLVPLPAELDLQNFPGEPLGCAMNIFERAQIHAGDHVAIVGLGFLGNLLIQLAVYAGAKVIALGRKKGSLAWAEKFGAQAVETGDRSASIEAVKQLTDGRFCDVVIEATGKQEPLHLAGEIARVRGRLVIAGYHQDGLREVNLQLWNWRGIDVVNAHERDPQRYVHGIRAAIDAVTAGRMNPAPLLTHRFPLEELNAALAVTRDRPPGFMKAMIDL